jgi:UTP--glucose-1-phosphate uridylyltransferase
LELVERFADTGLPSAGVLAVPEGDLSKYGVVDLEDNLVKSIVEKPNPADAPSPYVLCGRYLLPENTVELLELVPESEHGELQSIALLEHLINNGGFEAVKLEGYELYDSGDPVTWLKSQIDHGLRREDLSEELLSWLSERTAL